MGEVRPPFARHAAFVVLAVLALYSRCADFPFVNYDDNRYFYENPHVLTGLTRDNAAWAFGIHGPSMWIPLTWLSHQAMVSLFGTEPGPHHVLNVLLHAANAVLLLLFLRRTTGQALHAFAVALIFAIHPLHVESVAWVTERKDVLSLFFCLAALIAYEGHARRADWKLYPLVLLCHALAVMAKPLAVTLPCVMLLCDFWPLRRARLAGGGTGTNRIILEKLPLLAISGLASHFTVLCQNSIGAIGSSTEFPPALRLANAVTAYGAYLRRLLLPTDLAVFYPYPERLAAASVAVSLLVCLAAGLLALRFRKSQPAALFGLLWFGGTLVPMIGLVQAGAAAMADRYAYLPFIGLYIAVVWSVAGWMPRRPRALAWIAGLAACWLAALTWRQISFWKSSEALFSRAVAVTERNYLAHNNLGLAVQQAGRTDEARRQFELSVAARPGYPEAINNLAILEARQGRPDVARSWLEPMLAAHPDHATGWHNLAKVLADLGERDAAVRAFRKAIELSPTFIEPRYDLACLLMSADAATAKELLVGVVRSAPGHSNAWVNLGVLLAAAGDGAGAQQAYQKALAAQPANGTAHHNMALLLAGLGRSQEALHHMREAALHGCGTARHFRMLGEAFRAKGDASTARSLLDEALRVDPRDADAHNDLGVILGDSGDHAGALRHFREAVAIDPKHPRATLNLRRAETMVPKP